MPKNIIAMVYDCDLTLSPEYMQNPLLDKYGIPHAEFWATKDAMVKAHLAEGNHVQIDTAYLHQMVLDARPGGRLEGITKQEMEKLGQNLPFYPGIPEFFDIIRHEIESDEHYAAHEIAIEHYLVSTGLLPVIRTSAIAPFMTHMEAADFFYDENGVPIGIANPITSTQKTALLFEIEKGAIQNREITVNSHVPTELKRVSLQNMLYFGDGPSDVPCFATLRNEGGKTFGVYNPDPISDEMKKNPAKKAYNLHEAGRTHFISEADYRKGSNLYSLVLATLRKIADRIVDEEERQLKISVVHPPGHELQRK